MKASNGLSGREWCPVTNKELIPLVYLEILLGIKLGASVYPLSITKMEGGRGDKAEGNWSSKLYIFRAGAWEIRISCLMIVHMVAIQTDDLSVARNRESRWCDVVPKFPEEALASGKSGFEAGSGNLSWPKVCGAIFSRGGCHLQSLS